MIIKNMFKIHPFFYILVFVVILTGHFNDFVLLISLILFHEIGHVVTGIYYKWNIEKIILLPFGCLTIFNVKLNKSFKEEFLVSIMGFIFQFFLYFILSNFCIQNLKLIHYSLLFFNLLPIYPLDGFKILNILLNKMNSYLKSYYLSIYISFIFIIFLFLKFNALIYLTVFFLLIKNICEYKNIKYIFNKFLFERRILNLELKKYKIINSINKMYKYYKNLFYVNNLYITEKEALNIKFDINYKK